MKEKKGLGKIIRFEAIIPFTIIILLIVLYTKFFFDSHMKSALEWGMTKALGAEVNIASFQTKISDLSLKIQKIEITDAQAPHQNSIQIGEIRFSALWDAILRAKLVVNEAAIEQIEFSVPRKKPGYVAPPTSSEEEGPSAMDKIKDQALDATQKKFSNNVLGDAASWLGNPDQDPLEGIKGSVQSKALIEAFEKEIESKKKGWEKRFAELPKPEEFKALGDRMGKVKTSNFKNPGELASSLQELDKIVKEADKKYKSIDGANKDLTSDLKRIDSEIKSIESQVKNDIKDLENRIKLPKLDAQSLATSVFMGYLSPYKDQMLKYKAMALKYMPPNLKKKGGNEPDPSMQPRPRANGVSYEFGKPMAYPLVWIKKTRITSQAGSSPYSGNIEGEIRHISTNQLLTNEPIVADLKGNFPASQVEGFRTQLTYDNRKAESLVDFQLAVASYKVPAPKTLLETKDINLVLNESNARLNLGLQLIDLKAYTLNIQNDLTSAQFAVTAPQKIVKEVFESALSSLPEITLTAKAKSQLPNFPLNIDSNLGRELGKAFEKELKAQVDKAKKALQEQIDREISKNKAALDKQINEFKSQIQGRLDSLKNQAEGQKKQAENQIKSSQKSSENKAKEQIGKEAEKALKKLFGK